jgi:hypothetical protein
VVDADGHPDAGAIRRIRSLADRLLSVEEAREGLRARMNESEIADARTLIRWFRRRYDTPAKRLALCPACLHPVVPRDASHLPDLLTVRGVAFERWRRRRPRREGGMSASNPRHGAMGYTRRDPRCHGIPLLGVPSGARQAGLAPRRAARWRSTS